MKYLIRSILFFLLIVSATVAYGQLTAWCPPGSSWKYEYLGKQGEKGYISIDYVGDTVAGGKTCFILRRTRYYVPATGTPLQSKFLGLTLTRFEDKVVYVWDDYQDDFDTLFYFSSHPGDRYPVAIAPVFSQPALMRADLQARLSLQAPDNSFLTASEVQYDVRLEDGTIISRTDTLVDFVGIVSNYFFPASLLMEHLGQAEGGRFRCYSVNDQIIYHRLGAPACDYINAAIASPYSALVELYPQPVSGEFYLRGVSGRGLNQQAVLWNLTGHRVACIWVRDGKAELPEGVLPGVYFLQVQNDKGNNIFIPFLVR